MSDYKPHPLRVQRRRTKGAKLPPRTCCVTRPGKWGNPYESAEKFRVMLEAILGISGQSQFHETDLSALVHMATIARDINQLRGFNLACFCPLDRPCHVDVLAEWANR